MKKLLKKRLNQKGLTLIELLAVIVILAIVAAIAIPAISGVINNSRYNAVKADATNVINAAQLYFTSNPEVTSTSTADLGTAGFLEEVGTIPTGSTISKTDGLTTTPINFTGTKFVKFTNATVSEINSDDLNASEVVGTSAAPHVIGE